MLARQITTWLPGADVFCFSDIALPDISVIPLEHAWPGWWAKMSLFSPVARGDFLYLDLDSVVRGPLDDIAAVRRLTLLRDFYRDGARRPEGLQSAVMYLPEADRREVWDTWIRNPARWMAEYAAGGDQAFLERFWLARAGRTSLGTRSCRTKSTASTACPKGRA